MSVEPLRPVPTMNSTLGFEKLTIEDSPWTPPGTTVNRQTRNRDSHPERYTNRANTGGARVVTPFPSQFVEIGHVNWHLKNNTHPSAMRPALTKSPVGCCRSPIGTGYWALSSL